MVAPNTCTEPHRTPSRGFLDAVRAEPLPTRLTWRTRDTVALLALPAIFIVSWAVSTLTADAATGAVTDTALRIVIFVVLVVASRDLLARHWRAFRAAPWRSAAVVLAGLVAVQLVVSVLSALLRPFAEDGVTTEPQQALAFAVVLFASMNPVVTALIEDFTFRHTLLLKLPVWNRTALAAVVVLVNSLLFGAVHINNFDGQWLLTLSFAGAGLLMNLVYLWTRNIWHVLLMHGLNNFLLGGPALVLLLHLLGTDL